jgi:hypothetical protein
MPRIPFNELPAASRLWIFPAERPLSPDEETRLLTLADAFLDQWAAHGVPLTCARDWRYGRFLLVGVDEASEPPSGCSITRLAHLEAGGWEKPAGASWHRRAFFPEK